MINYDLNKNFITKILPRCLREFACTNKLILTGTPIQNNMNELQTLLNLLMPKLFNDIKDFRLMICDR